MSQPIFQAPDDAPPSNPMRLAWRRFRANRLAVGGIFVLAFMTTASVVGSVVGHARVYSDADDDVGRPRYQAQDKNRPRAAPQWPASWSLAHPFGATADGRDAYLLGGDDNGRDYLTRVLYGGVVSLGIGMVAAAAAVLFGTLYGLLAGYFGGVVDDLLMRTCEVISGLPYMLLVILTFLLLDALFKDVSRDLSQSRFLVLQSVGQTLSGAGLRSILGLLISVAAFNWMTTARVVRGQVLQLREMPYVEAARALGAGAPRILLMHLLPNLIGPVIVMGTLMVPQAILLESFLSFLGLGIQPPEATWGLLAAEAVRGVNPVENRYNILLPPCLALSLTLLSLNFVGDGLRDALDPHRRY